MKIGTVSSVIGQTPLIKIESLSKATGCEIFGKAEFLNPGGSVKDRTALGIIDEAERNGQISPGYSIVEGTAGNTGIGIATVAAQRGYKCVVVMPNNQASEKYATLAALGAEVIPVDPKPFSDQNHFYHQARRIGEERSHCFWANQFENTANYEIHKNTTGTEIWEQMNGRIDAFLASVGTGGTLAGVSRALKLKDDKIRIYLVDPFGSGLYAHFKTGTLASTGASITEGIGIMRLTANFKMALIDEAVQVNDVEMISMLYHLAKHDGLIVGTSAALNVFAAYKYALERKDSGQRIVTILGDSGLRYQSKVFNPKFLEEKKLNPVSILG